MLAGMNESWTGVTTIHPAGVLALCLAIIFLFVFNKNKVIYPLIIFLTFIPGAQRIVLFSLDFSFIRILVLVYLLKIVISGSSQGSKLVSTDKLIFLWALMSIIIYTIQFGEMSALITRLGYMVEVVGTYLVGRLYIRNYNDVKSIVNVIGILSIPTLIIFLIERSSGTNLFSVFGGVPEHTFIRDGKLRCQGPFPHPIIAGVFWASWLPLIYYFHKIGEFKKTSSYMFFISVIIIILNTASSTPLSSLIVTLIGLWLYKFYHLLRPIQIGVILLLIFLHLVMKAPVWHLLARIDLAGGSTGYHRFLLIDSAIKYFDEWWLVGTITTEHWARGMMDITNQYILEGVRGGFLSMMLFILILRSVFSKIGKKIKKSADFVERYFYWTLGVVFFVHAINFIVLSYFGQALSIFYLMLGAAVSITTNSTDFSENNTRRAEL